MSAQASPQQSLAARFIAYMLQEKPDLFFKLLRNLKPILVSPGNGPVFVTRFADVQEALSRPGIFNVTYAPMMDPSVGPFMLGRDNTVYNQRDKGIMRSLMQEADLPHVRQLVAGLVDKAVAEHLHKGQIEVVRQVSRKVPAQLTGAYFGFPGPDIDAVLKWSRATQYDMFHNQNNDPKIHQDNINAGAEMKAYLQKLLPQRREELALNPALDDILSRLLKTKFDSAIHFDDERIMTNIMGTLVGGIETTSQAIVQILDQLFKRPNILAAAIDAAQKDQDELLYKYCWEALRFNPINPFVIRRCAEDYKLAAGTCRATWIKKGSIVLVCTRSAMQDGRQVPYPSKFCIDRPEYHYMHMGYGQHTCLGDQVSRVQVPEVVKRLLKLPNVRPTSPIDFKGGPFPESYTIAFG